MLAQPAPTAREPEALTHLDALAAELTARGMHAVVTATTPTQRCSSRTPARPC